MLRGTHAWFILCRRCVVRERRLENSAFQPVCKAWFESRHVVVPVVEVFSATYCPFSAAARRHVHIACFFFLALLGIIYFIFLLLSQLSFQDTKHDGSTSSASLIAIAHSLTAPRATMSE